MIDGPAAFADEAAGCSSGPSRSQTALLATLCVLPAVASAAPPVAEDDVVSALSGKTYLDVLANDSDADSDPLSISDVSTPAHGTADIVTTLDGPRIR